MVDHQISVLSNSHETWYSELIWSEYASNENPDHVYPISPYLKTSHCVTSNWVRPYTNFYTNTNFYSSIHSGSCTILWRIIMIRAIPFKNVRGGKKALDFDPPWSRNLIFRGPPWSRNLISRRPPGSWNLILHGPPGILILHGSGTTRNLIPLGLMDHPEFIS